MSIGTATATVINIGSATSTAIGIGATGVTTTITGLTAIAGAAGITGTAGAGYLFLLNQSAAPTAPVTGVNVYGAVDGFSIQGVTNTSIINIVPAAGSGSHVLTITSGNMSSGSATLTLPPVTTSIAGLAVGQSWTAQQNWSVPAITFIATPAAINSTTTATAAQMAAGVITSTSASATAITTPTATALATQLGITAAGATYDFIIDNSAGSSTVTLTLDASIVVLAVVTGGNTLTVAATKIGMFRIYFTSSTAAFIARIA